MFYERNCILGCHGSRIVCVVVDGFKLFGKKITYYLWNRIKIGVFLIIWSGEKNSHLVYWNRFVEKRRFPEFQKFSLWEFRFVTSTYFGGTDQEKLTHVLVIIYISILFLHISNRSLNDKWTSFSQPKRLILVLKY